MSPSSPRLPLSASSWPIPKAITPIAGPEIAAWVETFKTKSPTALALRPGPQEGGNPPSLWVAIADPRSSSPDTRCIWALTPRTWPELQPFADYLAQKQAPFVVMSHGQAQLHALQALKFEPARLGCLLSAHTLLARSRGDSPRSSLQDWVAQAFDLNVGTSPEQEVDCLLPLMRKYTQELRALGLADSFLLESKLVGAVVAMEQAGMPVDAAAYETVAQGWVQERKGCEDEARTRKLDKLLSTYRYWARDYLDSDGRIRCRLDPLATESGRFSCASPNLQQVPNAHTAPGLRECFRPKAGMSFVVADYAQIELRIAAHIAACPKLRELFERGEDPHRNTAATLRGCHPSEVHPADRKLAKAINFGFLFGMGARRFLEYAKASYGLTLTDSQAQAAKSAFLSAYPGIASWQQRTAQLGRNAGQAVVVRTAMGRIKHFGADSFRFNAALNIPVQGTAAEGFKKAMLRLHRELPPWGGLGVLCIHDEYIAEVPTQRAAQLRDLVVSVMEQEMQSVAPSVPIRANATICEHWT